MHRAFGMWVTVYATRRGNVGKLGAALIKDMMPDFGLEVL